jgi:hypothetical protein
MINNGSSGIAGHETGDDNVQIYREVVDGAKIVYSTRPAGAAEVGSLDMTPITTPYPPLQDLQCKRLAARRHKTTFVYDYPSVFGNALKGLWLQREKDGQPGTVPSGADRLLSALFCGACVIVWTCCGGHWGIQTSAIVGLLWSTHQLDSTYCLYHT